MVEELQSVLHQLTNEGKIQLAPKTSSYKQWSERLSEYAESEELANGLTFWQETVRSPQSILPLDFEGDNSGQSADTVTVSLSKEMTAQLLKEAGKAYKTEINDLLLAALSISLSKWTQKNTITINLEGHGREDLFKDTDISRTVGWFTTQYPVSLTLTEEQSTADIIKSIKTKT